MNDATIDSIAKMVQDFGFPVIAAIGLGYFVFYVWKWVTRDISPTISESKKTLIGLIDKVRMLDNDMIRLNIKLKMILQQKEHKEKLEREFEKKNEKVEKLLNESK
jgi:cell shape-determining protein MreC